jgi:uncharacterized protein
VEKLVRAGLLYDFYGGLLTDKQRKTMELYYWEDWSLAEIGEAEGVSRQAVYDLLHRTERTMEEFEEKLGLVKRFLKEQQVLTTISKEIEKLVASIQPINSLSFELSAINQKILDLLETEIQE